MQRGDQVQQVDGDVATVVGIAWVPGAQEMYDLTVSQVHTFAVGDARAVVHNASPNCTLLPYVVNSIADGHHIHAKAAWRVKGSKTKSGDMPPYDMNRALVIKNADIARNGWVHSNMSARQNQLFADMARGHIPNTMKGHSFVAVEALIAGHIPKQEARDIVAASLWELRRMGIRRPFRIPGR